ncbi:MAG: PorP/SprF family type IX secretion system membrane protein [Chitinophagales bacterium]|nr:PorP/SprF family type IX secretion system membrane protein [Chitinophagales bacterium]
MKNTLLLILFLGVAQWGLAQDVAIFSHYNITPILINPSAAGFDDSHQLQLNARAQWTGFADAPQTYAAQYNGPLGESFGIGVGVLSETAAQMQRLRAHLNYAFRFDISKAVKLSAGFSTEYQQVRLDNGVASNNFFELGDAVIDDFMDGKGVFDASVGVFSSFHDNTRVGLSFTNLVRSRLSTTAEEQNESILRYYIFFASHKIDVQDLNFSFEPSIMVRNTKDVPSQLDINLKAGFLNESLIAGLSYRSSNTIGILLGTKLNNLQVLYSYDVFFEEFQRYNDGSHEVTVALSFDRSKDQGPKVKRY